MDGPSAPRGNLRVGRTDGWPPVAERRLQDPAYRPTHHRLRPLPALTGLSEVRKRCS